MSRRIDLEFVDVDGKWGRSGTRIGYWWESQRERDH
jgi:hypothetical protein